MPLTFPELLLTKLRAEIKITQYFFIVVIITVSLYRHEVEIIRQKYREGQEQAP